MATYTSKAAFGSSGAQPWPAVFPNDFNQLTYQSNQSSSSQLVFLNTDGTKTLVNGSGLSVSGPSAVNWSTLASVVHVAADGSTVLEQIDSFTSDIEALHSLDYHDIGATLLKDDDTVIGSTGADHVSGREGNNTFILNGGAGAYIGGDNEDTFIIGAGDWVPSVRVNGNLVRGSQIAGNARGTEILGNTIELDNAGAVDFRNGAVSFVQTLKFGSGTSTATIEDLPDIGLTTIVGSGGADALIIGPGSRGNDNSVLTFVNWTPGQDTITINGSGVGTSQNDVFVLPANAGFGGASVKAGAGDDTIIMNTDTGSVGIDGGSGTNTLVLRSITGDESGAIANIQRLVYDTGNSSITLSGAEIGPGAAQVSTVAGSSGTDSLIVHAPFASQGSTSVDLSQVTFTNWTDGVDTITIDTRVSGSSNRVLTGSNHPDVIMASGGNDTLNGGAGADTLNGGHGSDTLTGGSGADTFAFDANAIADLQIPAPVWDTIADYDQSGGAFNVAEGDKIDVSALVSTAFAQGAGQPASALVRAIADATGATLQVDPDGAANGVNWQTIAHLNGVHAGDSLAIVLDSSLAAVNIAVAAADVPEAPPGTSGGDTLTGGTGSDVLDGGAGNDTMAGGPGDDLYYVQDSGDVIVEKPGEGLDSVIAFVNYTLPANVEAIYTLVGGGAAGNGLDNLLDGAFAGSGQTLDGQGGNDVIYGTFFNDTLIGGAGSDALYDIGGNDTMQGDTGDNAYFVNSAADVVQENAGEGQDAIYASVNFTLPANVEILEPYGSATRGDGNDDANVLLGVASDHGLTLDGHGGNDVIYGSNFDDTLIGGAGDDLLWGFGGNDTMQGGSGNDVYIVEQVGDAVQENPGEGSDTIYASANITLPSNVENLFVYGAATSGTGNSGDNLIVNEFITSGVTLTGAGGNDTFVFIPHTANGTTVTDFAGNGTAAGDVLEFAAYGAGATFTSIDATHWQVTYNGGASHDIITFSNAAAIDPSDVLFV